MKILSLIAVLGLAFLQSTILGGLKIFSTKPDLLLCAMIAASFYLGPVYGTACAVLAGFFLDLFSPVPTGIHTAVFFLWSLVLYRLSRKISVDDGVYFAFLVFLVSIVNGIILKLVFLYFGRVIPVGIFLKVLLLGSLFTALVSPLFFRAARSLNRT